MDIFQASQIITVNGKYGAFELHTHNVEVPEKRFDDKELIEMATIPGKIKEIEDSLISKIMNNQL